MNTVVTINIDHMVDLNSTILLREEVRTWLHENVGPGDHYFWDGTKHLEEHLDLSNSTKRCAACSMMPDVECFGDTWGWSPKNYDFYIGSFVFKDPDKAMLFKLVWG